MESGVVVRGYRWGLGGSVNKGWGGGGGGGGELVLLRPDRWTRVVAVGASSDWGLAG